MPQNGDDFLVFSWNLEKKTLNVFNRFADTAALIAGGISRSVRNTAGEARPFVGFLMEVKGSKQSVEQMCNRLTREYRSSGGKALFEARHTGGGSYTREWMIVVSEGLKVKVSDLNVRDEMKREVEVDARNAVLLDVQKQASNKARGLRDSKESKEQRESRLRSNTRKEDEFRNGVIAEFRHGGQSYRVGSIHAPGPEIMESFPGALSAIQRGADLAGIDIMTGDLNKHGEVGNAVFKDIGRDGEGTTFSRKTGKLGRSRRDRSLVRSASKLNVKMRSPIAITRPGRPEEPKPSARFRKKRRGTRFSPRKKVVQKDWQPLTDHAMILTEVSPVRPLPPLGAPSLGPLDPVTPEPSPPSLPPSMLEGAANSMIGQQQTEGAARLTTPSEPAPSPLTVSSGVSEEPVPMEE
jgi:hypothetical protein